MRFRNDIVHAIETYLFIADIPDPSYTNTYYWIT